MIILKLQFEYVIEYTHGKMWWAKSERGSVYLPDFPKISRLILTRQWRCVATRVSSRIFFSIEKLKALAQSDQKVIVFSEQKIKFHCHDLPLVE